MYDVFLSFTRKAHADVAYHVRDILAGQFAVFVDEQTDAGTSITAELITALGASRLVVVIYSEAYNQRWACQYELIHAYLAGQAEGDASRRFLIVNPEPRSDHIVQFAVADSKYLGTDQLDRLLAEVKAKLARLPQPMVDIRRLDPPRWLPPQLPGAPGFTGRFPDVWRIHNALFGVAVPMTVATWSGAAAIVTGLPGIGKTSLVCAYAWLFGDLYRSGVYVLEVDGPGGVDDATARYVEQLRHVAEMAGVPADGVPPERLAVLLAHALDRDGHPFLWFVDGLPNDLSQADLRRFTLPARHAHTVFTAYRAGSGAVIGHVQLDGLHPSDGIAILDAAYPVPDAARPLAEELVDRLGGHPLILRIVAARLRDEAGLAPYEDVLRTIGAASAFADVVPTIAESMDRLHDVDHLVIALTGLLAPAPVPAQLISTVLALPTDEIGAALGRLRTAAFAQQYGDTWRVHPLVVEASAEVRLVTVDVDALARTAAAALSGMLDDRTDVDRVALLARHATALADRSVLRDTDTADGLCRTLARYHQRSGDLTRAAELRHRTAVRNPESAADAAAAALACVSNGEYSRALGHARAALAADTNHGADHRTQTAARWALAAALDGLGRVDEATVHWTELDSLDGMADPAQRIALAVARARARLARGRLREAAAILEPLAARADDDPDIDEINGARLELARVRLYTSAERTARTLAAQVVGWYRERDLDTHARALEAQLLWAETAVALDLFELRPDTTNWVKAEQTLARLATQYPAIAGDHSAFGLAAQVQQGLVLVRLGKQARCREVLQPVVGQVRERWGSLHPLYLRARYALGLAHLQLDETAAAITVLGETWRTQKTVLGPTHPETLHTQTHYGVALKFTDGTQAARILDDAWERLPRGEMGWRNDLYGILWTERRLRLFMPPTMMRAFNRVERWRKRLNGES